MGRPLTLDHRSFGLFDVRMSEYEKSGAAAGVILSSSRPSTLLQEAGNADSRDEDANQGAIQAAGHTQGLADMASRGCGTSPTAEPGLYVGIMSSCESCTGTATRAESINRDVTYG